MLHRLLILMSLLACAAASATETGQPPTLPDQFGRNGGLGDFSGTAVLAIVTTPRKLRWIGKWEEAIRSEIPDLESIRIADVTDRPTPEYRKVADLLRRRVPENISVLIDLENRWAGHYMLDTAEPCLVVFDSRHSVVAKFRGRPRGELVNAVIDTLRDYFPIADPALDKP